MLKKAAYALAESYKAFRLTPNPCLVMTLLVKNEEEMLEENLLFHKAMGVDSFIITDNNSTDGTLDIVRKYQQKGWVKELILEPGTNYDQKVWVDRMVWLAKTRYNADWVINADADELWCSPSGNLKNELSATRANVIDCEVRSVYPEEDKPFWQCNRMVKAVTDFAAYDLPPHAVFGRQIKKVIHRATSYLQISMGNHKVAMFPKRSTNQGVVVYHYNIRGRRQFMEKMINGGRQLEQRRSKHGGGHWRYFYQLYKENRLEQEYDRVIGLHALDRLCADGHIYTDNTIPQYFERVVLAQK